MSVIRQVKQKSGENSFNSYQLGAKASNVKMLDELNLEQQIIYGSLESGTQISTLSSQEIQETLWGEPNILQIFKSYYGNSRTDEYVVAHTKEDFENCSYIQNILSASNVYIHIFINKNQNLILEGLVNIEEDILQLVKKITSNNNTILESTIKRSNIS